MSEKVLMKGNEAIAEAAIASGCLYFFGYPITPQTEIAEYVSKAAEKIVMKEGELTDDFDSFFESVKQQKDNDNG